MRPCLGLRASLVVLLVRLSFSGYQAELELRDVWDWEEEKF